MKSKVTKKRVAIQMTHDEAADLKEVMEHYLSWSEAGPENHRGDSLYQQLIGVLEKAKK